MIQTSERQREPFRERAENVESREDGESERRTCFGVVEERVGRAHDAPSDDHGDGRAVVRDPRAVVEDGLSVSCSWSIAYKGLTAMVRARDAIWSGFGGGSVFSLSLEVMWPE